MSKTTTEAVATAPRPSPSLRRGVILLAAFGLAALVAVVLVVRWSRTETTATPSGTVKAFLLASVVDNNGFEACRYLDTATLREARSSGASCESMLSGARLRLGPEQIDREAEVEQLTYRARLRDGRAAVTVTAHGTSRLFLLRRGDAEELEEFQAPPTPWRIDSGVAAVLTPDG